MKDTSLDSVFIPSVAEPTALAELTAQADINMSDLRHTVSALAFNDAFDLLRALARQLVEQGRTDKAIEYLLQFDALASRMGEESKTMLDIHASLMQILTAIYLMADMTADATHSAATALSLLAQQPKRKDEPFLEILACLLYDIALMHNARDEHRQAERAIEKSMKLFERLAKVSPERYASPHLLAIKASTDIYQSRVKQTNTLAEHQAAASEYLRLMADGVEDAGLRLIESLTAEGRTLVKMNRHREAVQYFTRALKYLGKINPEFTRQHLELSIDLGSALLYIKGAREKGIHLLNTMLYKANKINADDLHRRVVDILINAKNPTLDIFSFWHKLFPR